jgi:hypothetical protein
MREVFPTIENFCSTDIVSNDLCASSRASCVHRNALFAYRTQRIEDEGLLVTLPIGAHDALSSTS